MAIEDKLEILNEEREQRSSAFRARALLQEVRESVFATNIDIQAIVDSGIFDTIDSEIIAALVKAWNVVKDAKAGFEDVDVAKLLDWST